MAFVVVTSGGRAIEPLAPSQRSLLRSADPKTTRKVTRFFADSPSYVCLLDSQIIFGLRLAFSQYREE